MTARSTLLLGALVALGFALVIVLRSFDASAPVSVRMAVNDSPPPAVKPHDTGAVTAKVASVAAAPRTEAPKPVDREAAAAIGQASGTIHFEKKPAERDAKGESIDLAVKSALGVWQPDGLVMRVLLLESRPDNVGALLGAIQSGETRGVAGRSAVLELRFVPTAQAFDRNELDSATLIVSDGSVTSAADALSSIRWAGSLPSPQAAAAEGQAPPTFTLDSSNETVSSSREIWKQSWRLSLTVPVVMR